MSKIDASKENLNDFFVECYNLIMKKEAQLIEKMSSADENISVVEIHILEKIYKSENNTTTNIANQLAVTAGTLSVALATLEKKGYIVREKDEMDKRIVRVLLTEKGERINKVHLEFHKNMIDHAVKLLTRKDMIVLEKTLLKLQEYFLSEKLLDSIKS